MDIAFAVVLVLLLWWAGTGVVLWLDSRASRTYRRSLLLASGVLAGALYGVRASAADDSPLGACMAFTMALLVWGWIELTFLTGMITGPRKQACAQPSNGWYRFREAVMAIAYHELAIAAGAAFLVLLTWGAPNKMALSAFLILWAMRLSAKLNLFLGVRNKGIELLPAPLRYLGSYFGPRKFNVLFPFSILGAGAVLASLAQAALTTGLTRFDTLSAVLLISLLGLGIFEHLLLVVPMPVDRMWLWWTGARAERASATVRPALDHLKTR